MTVATHDETTFEYAITPIQELVVETDADSKGRTVATGVRFNDEVHEPSSRFWVSLMARYSFGKNIFKYFDYGEVFERIGERASSGQVAASESIRVCVERGTDLQGNEYSRLLGASNPAKPVVEHEELVETLTRYNGRDIQYADGIVTSTHTPRIGAQSFEISSDTFTNQFVMSTPIDGYGDPATFLSLLRQICSNGMIGYSKAFRTGISLGKNGDDVFPSITRALDGFNSDEGFASLRQRVENAATSWASMYEAQTLYEQMIALHHSAGSLDMDRQLSRSKGLQGYLFDSRNRAMTVEEAAADDDEDGGVNSPFMNAFHQMTGDVNRLYGIANTDGIAQKKQRLLPVNCTVYDLINFATEVATHYASPDASRRLNGWCGTLVSDEYDLEGTQSKFEEFTDFHISAKTEQGMTGSEYAG